MSYVVKPLSKVKSGSRFHIAVGATQIATKVVSDGNYMFTDVETGYNRFLPADTQVIAIAVPRKKRRK